MTRKFYLYRYVLSTRSLRFRKYVCDCAHCRLLKYFSYRKSYKDFFNFKRGLTRREVLNLNIVLFDYCKFIPDVVVQQSSDFLLVYSEFLVVIAQIYIILAKHETYRLSYHH